MSGIAELLARIIARPDDDEARVAYADALVAAGDARGELIRCERALTALGIETVDDLVFSPLDGDAFADARALLQRTLSLRTSRLHRGFETAVRLVRAEDVAAAMARGPIETLEIHDRSADLEPLLSLPLGRLRALDLSVLRQHPSTRALLAAMPDLEALSIRLTDDLELEALAACPHLVELTIRGASAADVDRLARLPFAPTLRRLQIDGDALGVVEHLPALERLELTSAPAASLLATCRLPRELVLHAPRSGLAPFAANPALANVELLDLVVSDPEPDAIVPLASTPAARGLRRLRVRHEAATDVAFAALAAMATSLERLELVGASMSTATMGALLRRHRLAHLSWRGCAPPVDQSALAWGIAAEPAAATLRSLVLNSANLGDEGADALAASPHLVGLRRLHVADNAIHDGAPVVRAFPQLVDLNLASNNPSRSAIDLALMRGLVALRLDDMKHHVYVLSPAKPPRALISEVLREQGLTITHDALTTVSVRDRRLGNTVVMFILREEGHAAFANLRAVARIVGDPALAQSRGLLQIDVHWDTNEVRLREVARALAARVGGVAYDTRAREVL